MSSFVNTILGAKGIVHDVLRARREGKLPARFRPADLRRVFPDATWAPYISNFLSKHRRGNPHGETERFVTHDDGTWSFIGEYLEDKKGQQETQDEVFLDKKEWPFIIAVRAATGCLIAAYGACER